MADVEKSTAPVQPDKVDSATAAAGAESAAPAAAAADDDVKMDDAPPSAPKDAAPEKTAATEETAATEKAEKPAASEDVEMKDAKSDDDAPKAGESAPSAPPAGDEDSATKPAEKEDASEKASQMDTDTQQGQSETAAEANGAGSAQPTAHRKSIGAATPKGKLNKKASKGRILHIDCKPGDHFFARLKGFPPWPVIIADEAMLPQTMLSTRPVTAARPDGSYRFDFAEGGKRVADRTYPVMYLHTNEFSWTRNTDLQDLDPSIVRDQISAKMRKDLQQAHHLAAEQHSLEYYRQVLLDFHDAKVADEEAKMAKALAKKEKAEKSNKKSEAVAIDDDDDMDLDDVGEDDHAAPKKAKPAKKRKADEDVGTPQRSDSVKKPKIKLTTSATPKAAAANGVQSPQAGKESAVKASKAKSKAAKGSKEAEGKKTEEKAALPKEPELTPEERHMRKEKEILFLRHRLQKGLLNRDSEPKEDEMKPMSEFLAKLETFPDLEAAIIKATKINKVLKAILKLEGVPKEDEFKFKPRSQSLLDKWNKTLAAESATTPAPAAAPANGVNGVPGKEAAPPAEDTNGAGAGGEAEEPVKAEKAKVEESKEAPKDTEAVSKAGDEKPATEDGSAAAEPAAVEPAA